MRLPGEHPIWEKAGRLLYRLWLSRDMDRFERVSNLIYDRLGKHYWREIMARLSMIRRDDNGR